MNNKKLPPITEDEDEENLDEWWQTLALLEKGYTKEEIEAIDLEVETFSEMEADIVEL
jgi:hypothetical protein